MKSITMEYHYQAKMKAFGTFKIFDECLNDQIIQPLSSQDKVTAACIIEIHDQAGNRISTGTINWQVKSWDKVKTKV